MPASSRGGARRSHRRATPSRPRAPETTYAGSLNIDEYLRRLIALSRDVFEEELRAVTEDLSEEELAVFDFLTTPEPV